MTHRICAGRLSDRMREQFGPARIFMDVDSIEPGLDFGEVISEAVQNCRVMLVVIGPRWMASTESGVRRLDSPDDYVRIELEQALNRGVRVIPVLVDGAVMPQGLDLPERNQRTRPPQRRRGHTSRFQRRCRPSGRADRTSLVNDRRQPVRRRGSNATNDDRLVRTCARVRGPASGSPGPPGPTTRGRIR